MRLVLACAAVALVAAPSFADTKKPAPVAKATPKPKLAPAKVVVKPIVKPASVAAGTIIAAPNGKGCTNSVTKKFAKCPTPVKVVVVDVTRDSNGRCHFASGPKKGQFTKCP